jgi:transposase
LPELNPTEQFWSVLKSSVKREFVLKKDNLPKHIKVGTENIPESAFRGFARYSVKRFNDCLNLQPI